VFAALSFAFALQAACRGGRARSGSCASSRCSAGSKGVVDEVELGELGVTRRFGPRLGKKREERVLWDELVRVEILTTDEGPYADDFFFLLEGREGKGVAISNELAVSTAWSRSCSGAFQGSTTRRSSRRRGSTRVRRFLVWQKQNQPMPHSEVR
jgi:hypothetical protein